MAFVRHYAIDPEYAHNPARTLISRAWIGAQPAHPIFRATLSLGCQIGILDLQQPPPERSVLELYGLFDQFRSSGTTSPHDRVYGLLGLAEGIEDVDLHPDYSLPVKIMYANLVKQHVLKKYKVLDVLGYSNGIMDIANGIPLGVPDWCFENYLDMIFNSLDSDGKGVFKASGISRPELGFRPIADRCLFRASY